MDLHLSWGKILMGTHFYWIISEIIFFKNYWNSKILEFQKNINQSLSTFNFWRIPLPTTRFRHSGAHPQLEWHSRIGKFSLINLKFCFLSKKYYIWPERWKLDYTLSITIIVIDPKRHTAATGRRGTCDCTRASLKAGLNIEKTSTGENMCTSQRVSRF